MLENPQEPELNGMPNNCDYTPITHRRRVATTVFGENRHHGSDTASSFSPTRHTRLPQ